MSGDPSKCWYNLSGGNHHPQCQNPVTHENTRDNSAGDRPRWCAIHGTSISCGTQPATWTSQIKSNPRDPACLDPDVCGCYYHKDLRKQARHLANYGGTVSIPKTANPLDPPLSAKDIAEASAFFDYDKLSPFELAVLGGGGPLRWNVPGDGEKAPAGGAQPPQMCKAGHGDYNPHCAACDRDKANYLNWKRSQK